MDKDFYNLSSSKKLGWDPTWFGCNADDFDEDLISAVKKWQRKTGISSDGLVGSTTFRRIFTERESNIDDYLPRNVKRKGLAYIVHQGSFLPIKWDKVILWTEPHSLQTEPGTYYNNAGKPDRKPSFFVNHWDATLSSSACARIIAKRGISIHFCVDNDGTIYQLLDTQHSAWQCGSKKWNNKSIGVEISNAYYLKYQSWYERKGFGPRPIVEDARCHGRTLDPFLGFYDVQIDALVALWEAISSGLGIPLEVPEKSGDLITDVHDLSRKNKFKGFISHYHLVNRKIDCAGLDMIDIVERARRL